MATLISNVHVDGTWWGPAYGNASQVPDDVAALISNPNVWDEVPVQASDDPLVAEPVDGSVDGASVPPSDPSTLGIEHELPPVPDPVTDEPEPEPADAGPSLTRRITDAPDRATLYVIADQIGYEADRRIGVERLRQAMLDLTSS